MDVVILGMSNNGKSKFNAAIARNITAIAKQATKLIGFHVVNLVYRS